MFSKVTNLHVRILQYLQRLSELLYTRLMAPQLPGLSSCHPTLVYGAGTFNPRYNHDPESMSTTGLVHAALESGIRAFDTSPYYGPSEDLIGKALDTTFVKEHYPRNEYFLITKVGRYGSEEFDYSPGTVRASVERSLKRLRTEYLDVVYCHDVEFVSPEEVLEAVRELRRLREEGIIRYIGISGYPVSVLCEVAELILERTREPLSSVMSYANYTLQNRQLLSYLDRLKAASVSVVPNASLLGMGLLRRDGPPIGDLGDWHPAPSDLRSVVEKASRYCDSIGEKLENLALHWSLETWRLQGAVLGSSANTPISENENGDPPEGGRMQGVSVIGVSTIEELNETMGIWRGIIDTSNGGGLQREAEVLERAKEVRRILGKWADYAWASPQEGFVNRRQRSIEDASRTNGNS